MFHRGYQRLPHQTATDCLKCFCSSGLVVDHHHHHHHHHHHYNHHPNHHHDYHQMSTLWVVVGPGCTGLVEAETLPRGDFMTLLGKTIVIIMIIVIVMVY